MTAAIGALLAVLLAPAVVATTLPGDVDAAPEATSCSSTAGGPLTSAGLARLSRSELDGLYTMSAAGKIPNGKGRGQALVIPGTAIGRPLAALAKLLWQGKDFNVEKGILHNRILGFKLIKAKVFQGESWFDSKPAIILDYLETSHLFKALRDELREVAPGLYLGRAYTRGEDGAMNFMLYFVLDFNPPSAPPLEPTPEAP